MHVLPRHAAFLHRRRGNVSRCIISHQPPARTGIVHQFWRYVEASHLRQIYCTATHRTKEKSLQTYCFGVSTLGQTSL